MQSDFDMPSGQPVKITAYIDVSSGTPTTASNITTNLTYDSGTLLNLNNPTSVSEQGTGTGIYEVIWETTLDSGTTIPAGEDISLDITNNDSALDFQLRYDGSGTFASKIDLPTISVIDITEIGVYDAANGGGNLVNSVAQGETVYIRVEVEDPFGDYDITSLNLDIKDSGGNSVLTGGVATLTGDTGDIDAANVDSKRIYEYEWTPTTALATGNYTVEVEAFEGLETIPINDTDSTTISLNDGTVPDVTIGDANTTEGSQLIFDVNLSAAGSSDIILDLATTDNTATGISDYETTDFQYSTDGGTTWISAGGTNGTEVTIPAGDTSIQVRLDTVADSTDESDETFSLGISSVVSGDVGNTSDTGTGTITDDDPTPSISIDDVSLTEGDSSAKEFTFTVSLDNPSSETVTVDYVTSDGTAKTADSDYTAITTTTLSFAPGETSKTVTVNVTGDTTEEADQTFNVDLSSPTNATIADSQGTGTILNDDNTVLLEINNATVTEGDSGTQTLTFTVTRSGSTTGEVTIDYATADDTATVADNDYTSTTGTLTFADGIETQTISVTINGDTPPEANETFFVNLSNASSGTITDSQGIGTINNDDVSGTITGKVQEDTNNDDTPDSPLSGVTIQLQDTGGNVVDSTTTDSNGDYTFEFVTPGTYNVVETNSTGYGDVSEVDGGNDSDFADNGITNSIPVIIADGETDSGNNFVDEALGSISGTVLEDTNNDDVGDTAISGVTIQLLDSSDNIIDATTTNGSGNYSFTDVAPGTYKVLETDLSGYGSVSDSDSNGDNNLIDIALATGFDDIGNDFVDEQLISVTGNDYSETLSGGSDSELIAGYKGQDTLSGGGGDDDFFFNETSDGVDIITDFDPGDRLIFSEIIANETDYTDTGSDPIAKGYVLLTHYSGVGTMVQIDFDGSSDSNTLTKDVVFIDDTSTTTSLTASDFVF